MAARGITVIVASGNKGVNCASNSRQQRPLFPTSPYMTLVGATFLSEGNEQGSKFSSGGFTYYQYRPFWQNKAVNAYLNNYFQNTKKEDQDVFDKNGRAYPDVSALGQNMVYVIGGKIYNSDGTSFAAPIFAGIIALINSELLARGHPPLGWINQWMYENDDMFNDIKNGDNPVESCKGFKATTGWDPVTGLGTPNYEAMLAAAIRDAPKTMPTLIPTLHPSSNLIKEESFIETISTSIENFLFRISLVLLLILVVTVFLLWRFAGKSDNKLEYTPIRDNEDNDNA